MSMSLPKSWVWFKYFLYLLLNQDIIRYKNQETFIAIERFLVLLLNSFVGAQDVTHTLERIWLSLAHLYLSFFLLICHLFSLL